ncbi:MAG: TonB-dependent receptor [Acidobacteria bacterium]|nr:TonB-dependent receptor [Acidobacteriota bacterium]
MKRLITLSLTLLLLATSAAAQTSKGFVVGNVEDPNGAAVAGATIKITSRQTGVTRQTISQEDGSYRLDAVDPGDYSMEVTAGGFTTTKVEDINVAAAQTSTVPVRLQVGGATELVTVTAQNEITLQTESGTRVNTLGQAEITELPVAGLNPVNLVFTLPGVADPGGLASGFVQGTEFSVNGLRPRSNNQLIDGLDNNDNSINGQSYQPTVRDGYSEVAVLGSNYSAEYGRAGGAVVNVITRSGTNEFHGSVYDIIQNSAFNALTPGQIAIQELTKVPQFSENTLGFSLGGPIKKNKLFFFGTFQGDLFRSTTASTAIVPTATGIQQLRALAPAGANPALDRYLAVVGTLPAPTANRTPVCIQTGCNTATEGIQFGTATRTAPQPVDTYDYITRVDWTPNERDSLSFRYLSTDQTYFNQFPTIAGSQFPGFEIDVPSLTQNFYFNHTRTISTRTTNEFRFGYGRFNVLFGPRDTAQIAGAPSITINTGSITSVGLNSTFPQGRIFNNYQFQDTVTHTVGNHTLRFGADVLRQGGKQFVPINTRGSLSYTSGGGFTALGNFVNGFSGPTGTASIVFGSGVEYTSVWNQAYFINDQWRVRENLSLNLGLRYENFGLPSNAAAYPAFGGLFNNPFTRVEERRDNNNFAPRVSFAYTPHMFKRFFGEDRTVLRGGFAVNYDVFFNNILSNTIATYPNALGTTTTAPSSGRGLANFGFQSLPTTAVNNPQALVNTIDPNLVNPLTYVWNLGIQRELPGRNILDVAYVGSRGTHLFINEQGNPGINGVRVNPARGPITIRTNGGDSIYHSLQARFERGFTNGLQYRFVYTFSKAIDNTSSEVFVQTGGSSAGSDPFNRRADRSVASYDVPHRFVSTLLWNSSNVFKEGWLGRGLGGFTLGAIYRIQSGNVETPYVGGIDLNGDLNAFNDRPSFGNPNAPRDSVAFAQSLFGDVSSTGFFDLNGNEISPANARFIVDPDNRTNIAGRNTLRSGNVQRLDLSLQREFKLPFTPWESDRFQLRFDVFNVLNHPSFTFDNFWSNGDVLNPDFNQPYENFGTSRSARIQLRYAF